MDGGFSLGYSWPHTQKSRARQHSFILILAIPCFIFQCLSCVWFGCVGVICVQFCVGVFVCVTFYLCTSFAFALCHTIPNYILSYAVVNNVLFGRVVACIHCGMR